MFAEQNVIANGRQRFTYRRVSNPVSPRIHKAEKVEVIFKYSRYLVTRHVQYLNGEYVSNSQMVH